MGMFDFFMDINNYEERKINRFEQDGMTISTCSVSDGKHPYETGIEHPKYNNGDWVIVEAYDTKKEAQKGHDKWIKIMTAKKLPDKLIDCCNAGISELCSLIGAPMEFTYED